MCVDPANCGGHCPECQSNSGPIHVIPVDDLREHTASPECWCNPTLDDVDSETIGDDVWVHHSMDLREEYEDGRMLQ